MNLDFVNQLVFNFIKGMYMQTSNSFYQNIWGIVQTNIKHN